MLAGPPRPYMRVELTVNGETRTVEVEPRMSLLDCLRERLLLTGAHAGCEHGVCGACTVLIDGAPARSCLMFAVQADGYAITTIEGVAPGPGELSLIQDAFCETHGMQCGYCTPAMILTAHALLADNPTPTRADIVDAVSANICRCTGYAPIVQAIALAAGRIGGLDQAGRGAMNPRPFRSVSTDRRVREDRRFVVGKGRFAADIAAAGTRHVALVTCPHPAARILAIDKAEALAVPGVHYVLDGRELAAATQPLLAGPRHPEAPRRPAPPGRPRHPRAWGAAVGAETGALAEDAAELVRVDYQPLPFVLDGEAAYAANSPIVHTDHGSNVLLDRTFVWGEVEKDFAESPHRLSLRLKWGRSSTVPIETFAVLASWDPWREVLDVYASVQMPRFPDQVALALKLPGSSVRVHNDVDVGGSYGVKRGIKHAVLVGYLSRRLGFPVRLVEDRLENMRAGDGH